ncbi:hypothetical protein GOV03_02665 [Candidatus Woesearchaeota archaeon]|nr:hypothetical protein [Candidatus Woesearchaeota archaeon]
MGIFENDNSVVYIGSTTNFTEIGFSLDTSASKNAELVCYYCAKDGTWKVLTTLIDTTNGMKNSGTISFLNPSDRGSCNDKIDDITALPDTTNYSYIAYQRTANAIGLSPIESLISVGGSSESFVLTEDYIKLNPVSLPPVTCDASKDGALYYDSDIKKHCSCAAGTG